MGARTTDAGTVSTGRPPRILVVGVGGLGCPVALSLAAANAGEIVLLDDDVVEISNLPRQILFRPEHLGQPKAMVAAAELRESFPASLIHPQIGRVDSTSAREVLRTASVVVDAVDRAATKFLLNEVAVALRVPLVHGGAVGWSGQAMTILPGTSACLRCLFPNAAETSDEEPTCADSGVISGLPAMIGAIQAAEVLRLLSPGLSPRLVGRLHTIDLRRGRTRQLIVTRDTGCPACGPEPS